MEEPQELPEERVNEDAAPSPQATRIAELESQLAQARQEATENWNKFLRERAEMENFRKRQERITVDRVQQQKKALFHKILSVMDNVERALGYQDTPVPTIGETFNPYVHEAIEAVDDSDKPEGIIVEEVLKGYTLGDETLRPARVKVSTGNKQEQG